MKIFVGNRETRAMACHSQDDSPTITDAFEFVGKHDLSASVQQLSRFLNATDSSVILPPIHFCGLPSVSLDSALQISKKNHR